MIASGSDLDASVSSLAFRHWLATASSLCEAVLLVNGLGLLVFSNQRAQTLFASTAEAFAGQKVSLLQAPRDDAEPASLPLEDAIQELQEEGCGLLACQLVKKSGERFHAELSVSWVEKGANPLALVLVRDIDQTVRQRETWLDERRRFVEAQRIGNMGNWMLDVEDKSFQASDRVYAMYEIDTAEVPVPMTSFFRRVHPQDVERVKADFLQALESLGSYEHVFRLRFSDGREKSLRAKGEVTSSEGRLRVVGVVQDISSLVEAQRDRDRVASVLEATSDLVLMATPAGAVFYCNRAARELLGSRHSSRLDDIVRSLYPDAMAQQMQLEAIPAALRDGRWASETMVVDAQSRQIPMSQTILTHRSETGEIQYLTLVLHDISEQRATQALLFRQRQQLDEAQELARMGSWYVEMPGMRTTWSSALYGVLGYEHGLVTPGFDAFVAALHPDDKERVLHEMDRDLHPSGGAFNMLTFRIVTPEGIRHIQQKVSLVRDEEGHVERLFGTSIDVTEITEAEARLRQMNRELERRVQERTAQLTAINKELDTFAYSVSHDLKAPLRTIEGFAQCLEEDYCAHLGEGGRQHVARIRRGVLQMGELINGLLSYTKMERYAIKPECVDLERMVKEVLDLHEADIVSGGTEVRLFIEQPHLRADQEGVLVALRNLIGNAIKFSHRSEKPLVEIGSQREGNTTCVWVKDNGLGFDMRYHDRLFGLFQRLPGSRDFVGTGVGLALVAKAMQRMGGSVWAQSTPGKGATFYLRLPD
jgi:hypothetical protein